jgi:hypothetical protein
MFLDMTVRTQPIALRALSGPTRHPPHRKKQEEYEGSSCDFSPKSMYVVRYYAEKQRVIDQLNTELEVVVAKAARRRRRRQLDKVNKANRFRNLSPRTLC